MPKNQGSSPTLTGNRTTTKSKPNPLLPEDHRKGEQLVLDFGDLPAIQVNHRQPRVKNDRQPTRPDAPERI